MIYIEYILQKQIFLLIVRFIKLVALAGLAKLIGISIFN